MYYLGNISHQPTIQKLVGFHLYCHLADSLSGVAKCLCCSGCNTFSNSPTAVFLWLGWRSGRLGLIRYWLRLPSRFLVIPRLETRIVVMRESVSDHSIGRSQGGGIKSQPKYSRYPHLATPSVAFPIPQGQAAGYY